MSANASAPRSTVFILLIAPFPLSGVLLVGACQSLSVHVCSSSAQVMQTQTTAVMESN